MAPALILMGVSAAVSAVGAISAANAQAASYKSQQQAANYNATADFQNANAAQAAASANEMTQRRQNDQIMGEQRARVAESAGGFTGTNVGVLAQSGTNLELSALNQRYQGQAQAHGLLAQTNLAQYQSQVAGINANNATNAGYIGAAAGALGTTASYANARSVANLGFGG